MQTFKIQVNLSSTVSRQAMVIYDRAADSLQQSSRKVETDKRVGTASDDSGGLSVSMELDIGKIITSSQKVNLQNFITLSPSQDDALAEASRIYERMSVLAQMATDPFLTEADNGASSDKELLNIEFKELSERLSSLIDLETNGRRLFGWVKTDFTQGLQDRKDFSPTNLPQITTKDVQSTSGMITLDLCPGSAEDQIWVCQGELPSDLDSFYKAPAGGREADTSGLSDKLYDYFDGSKVGNFDTFKINFNTCEVNLDAKFYSNNQTAVGTLPESPSDEEIKSASYDQLYAADLIRRLELDGEFLLNPPSGNSTKITVIGVNTGSTTTYEVSASYEPTLPYNDINIPGSESIFPEISFSELDCSNISTTENDLTVLNEIDAQLDNLSNSRASTAATQNRYNYELSKISLYEMSIEATHSRIVDADFAQEATNLARQMRSTQMATASARKSMKFMDLLISLTTKHHRSHVLEAKLY